MDREVHLGPKLVKFEGHLGPNLVKFESHLSKFGLENFSNLAKNNVRKVNGTRIEGYMKKIELWWILQMSFCGSLANSYLSKMCFRLVCRRWSGASLFRVV